MFVEKDSAEKSNSKESNAKYEEYVKAKVLQSLQNFKKNGSTGVPMEEVKQMVRDRVKQDIQS